MELRNKMSPSITLDTGEEVSYEYLSESDEEKADEVEVTQ